MKSRISTVVLAALSLLPWRAGAAPYGVNLLANGSAEAGTASSIGAPVEVPGWTPSAAFTVVPYGAPGGFPTVSQGPPDAMKQFFAGGNAFSSTASQVVDISANAADIDAGKVACDVSGYLGGFADQDDSATFNLIFRAADQTQLGSAGLTGVTRADRASETKLLFRSNSVIIPAGTRSIEARLLMLRISAGTFNDGYADSLSVVLRGPAVVTNTADAGPGSLRDALSKAGFITFDPQVFAAAQGPKTITLLSSLAPIRQTLTIIGPGANLLTIRRSGNAAEFTVVRVSGNGDANPTVLISGLTIANGGPAPFLNVGGGIDAESCILTVRDCTFNGNSAFDGGGIRALDSTVELNGCTFSGNSANRLGGAIYNQYAKGAPGAAVMNIVNCTISGNANTGSKTGVIANFCAGGAGSAMMIVSSSTVVGNTNGAFHLERDSSDDAAVLEIDNTIIALNGDLTFFIAGFPGQYISNGYNLSSNSDAYILHAIGDQNNTYPVLGELEDNGGSTPTHALLPGSPAIDKGYTTVATDQRGFPRPIDDPASLNGGNSSDIGAFEVQITPPSTPTPTPASTATPTPRTTLGNISTRLRVQTGDNVVIAGFIVTGTQQKKVIIRGIGPSLPIAGRLDNPTLELRDAGGTLLDSNDDWVTSPNQQAIIDSTIPPSNNLESAIVATLPANGSSYTAIVRGANGGTGIGVVEVYDLGAAADSKLANVSTRGLVQTGENVMIAGTIVVGATPQKVIVRAIGPSLSVTGVLADPTLELHDSNGVLLDANDNWTDSANKQAIIDSTIPPTNNLESAIVRTLTPGNYTAIVGGANNTIGIAVVEMYALP